MNALADEKSRPTRMSENSIDVSYSTASSTAEKLLLPL